MKTPVNLIFCRIRPNGSWFVIHEVLNFPDSTLWCHEPFQHNKETKNQWIYQSICNIQIIWKLSYINLPRIIVLELFGHWTMLIVFLFFVLIVPYGSQSSQITYENFILEFPKNMIKFASLLKRSYKISPVCLSICPSTCDAFFSGSPLQIFFNFLHDISPYTLKSDKARFWKIVFLV